MVRLKVLNKATPDNIDGFNSTMVRLKGETAQEKHSLAQFQFHNGSIKSIMGAVAVLNWLRFQFHNGSIKRIILFELFYRVTVKFQFHNGSIKSRT